jgi:hypothetical protein
MTSFGKGISLRLSAKFKLTYENKFTVSLIVFAQIDLKSGECLTLVV